MQLQYLKLKNIRSYINETIDFPKGSLLLSGDIGSGKSTILMALEFALFGVIRGKLSGSNLLRHGKTQGSVELKFNIENKEVIIFRGLKKGKNAISQEAGYIVINGRKTDAMPVELKAKVIELIGYPIELVAKSPSLVWRYTVYTPQEEMKLILSENSDERLNTIRKVFGIDKYKRVKENTTLVTRDLKQKKRELEAFSSDFKEKQQQARERDQEIKELKIKLDMILPEIEARKKRLELKLKEQTEREKKLKELLKVKNELESLEKNKMMFSDRVSQLNEEKSELDSEMKKLKQQINEIKIEDFDDKKPIQLEKEVNTLQEKLSRLTNEKIIVSGKLSNLEEQKENSENEFKKMSKANESLLVKKSELIAVAENVERKSKLEEELKKLEKELEILKLKINELDVKRKDASETIKRVSKMSGCPVCLRSLDDKHKHSIKEKFQKEISDKEAAEKELTEKEKVFFDKIKNARSELEKVKGSELVSVRLKTEIRLLEKESTGIVEKQKVLNKIIHEKETLAKKKQELDSIDFSKLEKELNSKKELEKKILEQRTKLFEKKSVERLLEEKQKRLYAVEKEQDVSKKNIEEAKKSILESQDFIAENSSLEKEFQEISEKINSDRQKIHELDVNRAELRKEKESAGKILEMIETELKNKLKAQEKIVKIGELVNWAENFFVNLVSTMEKHVMAQIYTEFNQLFKDWFGILIEDELINSRLNDEFSPVIEQNGFESEMENLSGGERTSVALAYRLSLNKVINDFIGNIKTKDLIILDEPTDGFSTEQLDKVREVLEQLNVKQVIIVSHEEKMESFVENVIKIEKEEHVSKVIQ